MTKEELKQHCEKQVKMCEEWAKGNSREPSGKIYEEHKLILDLIKTLEQQSDDCVSFSLSDIKDIIDKLDTKCNRKYGRDSIYNEALHDFAYEFSKLRHVTLTHGTCKDCCHRDPEDKKCDCGHDIIWQLPREDNWYCVDFRKRDNKEMKDKKQIMLNELSKESEMVIATAYLYAKTYTMYGEDITKAWTTATQHSAIVKKAYNKGYADALLSLCAEKRGNSDGSN